MPTRSASLLSLYIDWRLKPWRLHRLLWAFCHGVQRIGRTTGRTPGSIRPGHLGSIFDVTEMSASMRRALTLVPTAPSRLALASAPSRLASLSRAFATNMPSSCVEPVSRR